MSAYNFSCYYFTKWVQYGQLQYNEFIVFAFVYVVIMVPAIFLNALILVSIYRTPALQTPKMTLVSNLAFFDFGVGLVAQPVTIAWMAVELRATELQETYCYMSVWFMIVSIAFPAVSFFSVIAIAVDRFLALYLHLRYHTVVTMKKAFTVCAFTWVSSIILVTIWLTVGRKDMVLFGLLSNPLIFLFEMIVLGSYFQIFKILQKHKRQIQSVQVTFSRSRSRSSSLDEPVSQNTHPQNLRQYKKSLMSSFYIYLTFILCYLPLFITMTFSAAVTTEYRISAYMWKSSCTILVMNSAINPAIYCWKMRELRNAVRQTVMWLREMTGLARNEGLSHRHHPAQLAWSPN
ncbi:predicted protein [Nematostella vectensis]|uniref:G-protein coupled receptors family 1 profile domain-containing protein n=1 Tax=Nematostella vectensis TaxID=45351 RepID=A7SH27_NEMVE|nr:melanocyte-stimulating hormone receptor [Nematostella vectensis]EDO36974.1 predicted protein [Nematostella vectensis]|eukprot:XP_001629037.1 predicted protein [Nematostella vectensis]